MNVVGVVIVAIIIHIRSREVSSAEEGPQSRPRRVVGGSVTSITQYPFLVSLSYHGVFICGGSIISEIIILSAAHCIVDLYHRAIIVRAGSTKHFFGGTEHQVIRAVLHHDYHGSSKVVANNDIALLKLGNPIQFSKYANYVQLYDWSEPPIEGSTAISIGWGRFNLNEDRASERLKHTHLRIIPKNDCAYIYQNQVTQWSYDQICAYLPSGGHCKGDSGGPLIVRKRLAGIISWDTDCSTRGLPGVYTEVAIHRPWIDRNVNALYNDFSYA